MTNDQRLKLLDELAGLVELDFPDCDGHGSVFCPACIAHRAIKALYEVYEDEEAETSLVATFLPYEQVIPTQDSETPVDDLDEIADRILHPHDDEDDNGEKGIHSDNLVLH